MSFPSGIPRARNDHIQRHQLFHDLPGHDTNIYGKACFSKTIQRSVIEHGIPVTIGVHGQEFGRQTESRFEPIDVNKAIVDDLFFLEKQVIFHDIKIIKHLDPSLPPVEGDPNQIKQVFMNMMVNADEAMSEGGGALTIATGSTSDGESIFISFKDEGTGIPTEIQSKICDPFFTTKGVGKGTGLGLSTSYGIIQSHHGNIDVESQPGKGTTFTIYLPRSEDTTA